jgi:hypothetical protein
VLADFAQELVLGSSEDGDDGEGGDDDKIADDQDGGGDEDVEHDDMSEEVAELEDHIASVPLIFALVGRVQIQP